MKKTIILLACLCSSASLFSQQYRPLSSSEIHHKLQQLNVLGTVMYVAAHPDDENTRLISYLVHHDHVRTVYLSLTRGDGGQNILGDEQGSTLGLIRTHELIEARKIDGAEQMFTPVIDFGFTKSPEETFKFWDKQKLIDNVKEAYQKYKPDVIICRFPTTGEGGHGQHTVSAIVAEEAFKQIQAQQNKQWLPTRILFNAFRFGDRNTTSEDQFKLPINQYEPLLGEGYGEMAGRSRSIHRSQGAGTPQSVGLSNEYFKFLGGKPIKTALYDDVDITWNRVGRKEIGEHLQKVIDNFDFKNPSSNIPALISIKKEIETVRDDFWKQQKLRELNEIIVSCAGVLVEALTNSQEATAGATIPVTVNIIARSKTDVNFKGLGFPAMVSSGLAKPSVLTSDSLYKYSFELKLNDNEAITEPYWLKNAATTGSYKYDSTYGGLPQAWNNLSVTAQLNIGGEQFYAVAPISYKRLDPVKGDVVQRLRIVPAVSVEPVHSLLVFESGSNKAVWLRLKAFKDIKNAVVEVKSSDKVLTKLTIPNLNQNQDTLLSIDVPTATLSGTDDNTYLTFNVLADGKEYNRDQHLLQYDHLPDLQYFTGAWMKVLRKDWTTSIKKVGYIEGAGDYVDGILSLCGLDVEHINANVIANPESLHNYEAIVVGIRALNTEKRMASWMPSLLQYVQNGGTLIVQYNTNQNLVTQQFGPYPFSISRDRVTEEDAAVSFTQPESVLLQKPNKITKKDFDNWVQERGVYYPSNWDAKYQTVLSMHDTGEKDLQGAILYTPYGKGQFVYTSLAFFRQLPAGNVGAIRLMMNLLSAGK